MDYFIFILRLYRIERIYTRRSRAVSIWIGSAKVESFQLGFVFSEFEANEWASRYCHALESEVAFQRVVEKQYELEHECRVIQSWQNIKKTLRYMRIGVQDYNIV